MAAAGDNLSMQQLDAISIIERTCSVLSLLGSVFVIATFCCSKSFHKPINRLVFYASFGNMMTNVGTLMSRTYLDSPDSVGCQFQAFLIQMFMPADAFWTLAMAINVYLTFYYKFDARRLRKMELPYLIGCYGIPLVPAFVYIFLENKHGQRVYGNAQLWCWVTPAWDIWRIVTFYGPIWVVIIITFFIYLRAGRTIYLKRKQLYNISSTDPDPLSFNADVFGTLKTTEIWITTEVVQRPDAINLQSLGRPASRNTPLPNAYSVTISAAVGSSEAVQGKGNQVTSTVPEPSQLRAMNVRRKRNQDLNNAAWSYTKCAILFFTAILITWIPSSANRVYSVIHKPNASVPLEFMSAFVLPLQGFWNAIIYCTTSWGACKSLVTDIRMGRRPEVTELLVGDGGHSHRKSLPQFKATARTFETESMTELAHSRPTSEDERRS